MSSKKNVPAVQGSNELRAKLPKGAIASLAKKYGVSWTFIQMVATGKSPTRNHQLMNDLKKLARIEAANRKRLSKIL